MLLLLAHFGKEGVPETVIPGSVRKRSPRCRHDPVAVSFFMNRFRKLGFVDYARTGCKCIVHC